MRKPYRVIAYKHTENLNLVSIKKRLDIRWIAGLSEQVNFLIAFFGLTRCSLQERKISAFYSEYYQSAVDKLLKMPLHVIALRGVPPEAGRRSNL